jgi:AcrR family transcriptional regulator
MTSERQPTSGITREIELLWGLRETAKRGPKPKLSRAAIVRAAVVVADAENLEAVSMQRVAKELGYTTMSLYRHLESKEDLLTLMSDAVMSENPPGPRSDGDWRAGTEEWCAGVMAQYRAHPWAVYVPQSGPPSGPNGLRWMEAGLREITASGLTGDEALQMLTMLSNTLRDVIRMENDMVLAARRRGLALGEAEAGWTQSLRQVLDPREFPTVAATLEEGVFEEDPQDYSGEPGPAAGISFAIHRVLDGVEAYVLARRGSGRE